MRSPSRLWAMHAIAALTLSSAPTAIAQTLTWDSNSSTSGPQDGAGNWNLSGTTWWNGTTGSNVVWPNTTSSTAAFGAGGTPATVTIPNGTTVTAGGLVFGAVNNAANSGYAIQSGTLSLGANATITLAGTTSNQITTIWSRVVASDITITATSGAQTVQFRGSNSITGTIAVQPTGGASGAGVSFTSAASLSSATLDLRSGARWTPTGGETYANNVLISGTGYGTSYGVIGVGTGAAVLSGTVTMTGDSLFYGNSSGTLTIQKGILESGGSRSMTIANGGSAPGGVTILQGASTYTGTTVIGAGIQTIILDGGDNRLSPQTKLATLSVGYAQKLVLGGTLGGAMRQSLAGLSSSYASLAIVGGASGMSALDVTVASGTNTYAGVLGGTAANENNLSLSKAGAGTLALTGSSTHTGTTSLTAGTLAIGNVNALRNSTLDVGSTVTFTVSGTNTYNIGGLTGATSMAVGPNTLSIGGNNESTTYSGVLSGSSGVGLTKIGTGVLALSGSSTLSGPFTIGNGAISVATIGNSTTANPLGTSGTVNLGTSTTTGTLRYTGSGETSNRGFNLSGTAGSGGVIEANGSGPLAISGAVTAASGSKTLTLAGLNTGSNAIGAISSTAVSLVKTGAGTWILTGSSSYGGTTTVDQGTLVLAVNALNTVSGSGALGTDTANITIGSATGSGTAALLLNGNVTVGARTITIPAVVSGSQGVVLGGANASGTSTFNNGVGFVLGRDVTLQAATGGTVVFDNAWTNGTGRNVTIGSAGNAGTVQLGAALTTTGAVSITTGTLRLASGGSISDPASVIVGTVGSSGAVLDVTPQVGIFTTGSTQTLGGIGTIHLDTDTPVSVPGFFSPGNSPGIFTFQGDGSGGTTTLSGTTFMEITGTTAGTSYDQVRFTSGATLNYGSGILLLDLIGVYADNTQFQLFDFATTSQTGSFTTISGSGSYGLLTFVRGANGVWTSGLTTQPNQSLEFREATGMLVVVPEPATLALAAIGIGLAGCAALRRRK